jgi:cytochrome P450
MSSEHDLPMFPPPRARARPLDPPPELPRWLADSPVRRVRIWSGVEAWLVTRYEDARLVFTDPRFSVDPTKPGFPEKNAAYSQVLGQDRNLRTMDMPEHAVQKRMLNRDFTIKRMEEMRPAMQAKIDALVDAMLAKGSPADIVRDLAFPLPMMVICELLGIPYEDRDYFAERAATCLSMEASAEKAAAAGRELYDYTDKLLDRKDANPQNDLLSRLVVEQVRNRSLTRKEVIELARLMLVAGYETTANTICLCIIVLLQHPEQMAELRGEPALMTNAVEELLRFISPTHAGRRRVAVGDVVVGGQLIKAGEGVIIANHVSDRDPAMFPDPNRFDIHRSNARANLAFGSGIHQCLGQQLARAELRAVFETLLHRVPSLRLGVPAEALEFYEGGTVYSVRSLPVTWN